MRKREMERLLARHVAPAYPALTLDGDRLVQVDGPLARGLLFDRSQLNPRAFRVSAFVIVLSVPADHLSLGDALDVGDFTLTDEDDERAVFGRVHAALHPAADVWLAERATLTDVADRVRDVSGWQLDGRLGRQIRAHCLAHLGRHGKARRALKRLRLELRVADAPDGLPEQVDALLAALDTSPAATHELLDRWTAATRAALGLDGIPERCLVVPGAPPPSPGGREEDETWTGWRLRARLAAFPDLLGAPRWLDGRVGPHAQGVLRRNAGARRPAELGDDGPSK